MQPVQLATPSSNRPARVDDVPDPSPRLGLLARLALATFLSAALLFQVQPLVSRALLPWFGGTTAVWTTAMLFFQAALLAGYALAWWLGRIEDPRRQTWAYLALLAVSLVSLPILPSDGWKPADSGAPTLRLLVILAVSVGLPYVVLAITGPLAQAWFHRAWPTASPYRLYALSNAGSLAGLLGYPLVVEPLLGVRAQGWMWTAGYAAFIALMASVAWSARGLAIDSPPQSSARAGEDPCAAILWRRRLAWLGLSAAGVVLLLATTNQLCRNLAVVPLLWVAPLAVYLLTFIVAFDRPAWYRRGVWAAVTLAATTAVAVLGAAGELRFPFIVEVGGVLGFLFAACFACHGELARLKPPPAQLTGYYLHVAIGGVLGALAVNVVAPLVFRSEWEWPLSLVGTLLGAILIGIAEVRAAPPTWRLAAWLGWGGLSAAAVIVCLGAIAVSVDRAHRYTVWSGRNFYGTLHVDLAEPILGLRHGHVLHGVQFLDPARRGEPTAYYGRESALGRLWESPETRPRRVGAVGLGAGVLAAYGTAGDFFRFYEINPQVVQLAEDEFTFLDDLRARGGMVDVVLGDARLTLEREPPQEFDLLVLDAFSGDSVPTHLLTREALATYLRHLRPDGLLAAHISNQRLNLMPVLAGLARDAHLEVWFYWSAGDTARATWPARWAVLRRRSATGEVPPPLSEPSQAPAFDGPLPLWTDDHTPLFDLLKAVGEG